MKRLVQLLRFGEVQPILIMNYVFDELTCAFKDYDCEVRVVTSFEDVKNEGIIFLDNGALSHNNLDIYNRLASKCPDVLFIVWYWVNLNDYKPLEQNPFQYMISLGNNILKKPSRPHLINEYNNYMPYSKYCPLKFRANEHPDLVGTFERKVERDYCFMGYHYRREWVPFELNGIYHATTWENYLSYDERKKIYLSSMFALGFHGDDPIDCGSISQRVFEGMAYGCIVLTDNPMAEELTDGIAVLVTSKNDVLEKINYYKAHPELVIEKQKKGYEWVKKYGTNRHSVKVLLDRIKEIYGMEFN
jgi:hypothetical protein